MHRKYTAGTSNATRGYLYRLSGRRMFGEDLLLLHLRQHRTGRCHRRRCGDLLYDFPSTLQDGRVAVVVLMQRTRIATTAACLAPVDDDLLRRWNNLLLGFLLVFGRVGNDQRLLRLLLV